MSTKLSDLFQASCGEPVEWAGQDVHMMYDLASPTVDQVLLIRFGQPSPARTQALRIRARRGLLEVNGQTLDDVVLWSDSTPETVVVGFGFRPRSR